MAPTWNGISHRKRKRAYHLGASCLLRDIGGNTFETENMVAGDNPDAFPSDLVVETDLEPV